MMDLTVCIGSSCHIRGSRDVVKKLEALIAQHELRERINLRGSFCMGACERGACVHFGGKRYALAPEGIEEFFDAHVLPVLKEAGQ